MKQREKEILYNITEKVVGTCNDENHPIIGNLGCYPYCKKVQPLTKSEREAWEWDIERGDMHPMTWKGKDYAIKFCKGHEWKQEEKERKTRQESLK